MELTLNMRHFEVDKTAKGLKNAASLAAFEEF